MLGTLRAIVKGGAGSVLVIDASENPKVNASGGVAGATSKHHGLVGVRHRRRRARPSTSTRGTDAGVRERHRTAVGARAIVVCRYGIEVTSVASHVRQVILLADDNGTVVIPKERIGEVSSSPKKVKATEERVIAEIERARIPVEAHQKVNYDDMLKAQSASTETTEQS